MQLPILPRRTIVSDPYEGPLPGVSIQEAAEILNVSTSTIRRWCVTGRIHSERVLRLNGVVVRVFIDRDAWPSVPEPAQADRIPLPEDGDGRSLHQARPELAMSELVASANGTVPAEATDGLSETSAIPRPPRPLAVAAGRVARAEQARADATVALVAATANQVIAPFVAEYTAVRQLVERQAQELRDQAELIGRLSSDLDHARETINGLAPPERQTPPEFPWALVGLILVLLLLAASTFWMMR